MIAFDSNSVDESRGREVPSQYWDEALHRPVKEFLRREGKRIRSDLVEFAYSVSQGRGQLPTQIQGFVELLHAGSLIVDDIQDDAETRRNLPALHRVVGTPLAINTGNWMYFAAFEKLVDLPVGLSVQAAIMRRALSTVRECHEGQALDLAMNVAVIDWKDVAVVTHTISKLKTGGLVSLAAWLGAAVAGAKPELRKALSEFGMRLGMALQMQNDLAELRTSALERVSSNDLVNSRVTWPWAWAAQVCTQKEFVRLQHIDEIAVQSVSLFECVGTLGSDVVKCKLRRAFAGLRRQLGDSDASRESNRILERLEKYHV
jgi:geranylgeranyl pyrophosphate synthase